MQPGETAHHCFGIMISLCCHPPVASKISDRGVVRWVFNSNQRKQPHLSSTSNPAAFVVCAGAAGICWAFKKRKTPLQCYSSPSFESFCDNSLGTWKGWSSKWLSLLSLERTEKTLAEELDFTECDTKVRPIMRNCAACAGVIQGTEDWVRLDRDQRGFVFFDCGSWSADVFDGDGVVATSTIQMGDQRQVVSCRMDSSCQVKEVQLTLQSLSQRGSVRPPAPVLRSQAPGSGATVARLKHLTSWEKRGIQGKSRSAKSFISTRLSWKSVATMDLWEGAHEYALPNGCLAVKVSTNGFWLLVVTEQGLSAKIIAREYAIQPSPPTPMVVSVALLDLMPSTSALKRSESVAWFLSQFFQWPKSELGT